MISNHLQRFWSGFWQIADPKIWIASTIPMTVGGAIAFSHQESFSWQWFLIGVVAIYLLEIGKNAINEYIDYLSGADRYVTPENRTPFSGGKKTIIDGKLSLGENLAIGILTIGGGSLLGLYVVVVREFAVLWIGLAGVFFALFYSLPPFKFSYRGLGELVVGFTFGPLITMGTYLVQTHTISLEVFLASLPLGLIIANVLWINQYPDYEADLKGGKMNGVVRLGREKGVIVYAFLFAAAYFFFLVLTLFSGNFLWLLPLLTLPLATRAIKVARLYYNNIPRLIEANAKTIQVYQLTGAATIAAVLLPMLTR